MGAPAEQGGTPTPPPAPPEGGAPTPPPAPPAPGAEYSEQRPGPASDTSKLLAALGYLSFGVVAVVALLIDPYKNEKFVRFHAWQAIGLLVGLLVLGVVYAIPVLGWIAGPILNIVLVVLVIVGFIKAFQGQYWEMPVIYDAFKGSIGE